MNTAEHHPFLPQQYRRRQQLLNDVVTKIAAELDGFRFDIQRVLACGDVAVSQLRYAGTVNRARNFTDAYRISTVMLCQRAGSGSARRRVERDRLRRID